MDHEHRCRLILRLEFTEHSTLTVSCLPCLYLLVILLRYCLPFSAGFW